MNTTATTFNAGIAYNVYHWRLLAFAIAGITAFVMSAYFVVGYYAGNLHFWTWGTEEWLNALPSIGLCLAMTLFQVVLYSKDSKAAGGATILAICIAAGFSVLSEVGQGMERDNIRMETKSQASPAYQALVNSLGNVSGSSYTPYTSDLKAAKERLATCHKKVQAGIYRDCAESKARLAAVQSLIEQAKAAQASKIVALANTAKQFERDENNYHPLVNLIRQGLGVGGVFASFLLSLTIIVFFEYAFHYLGRRFAESRDDLHRHGFDTTRRIRRTPRHMNQPSPPADPTPDPALQEPVTDDQNSSNSTGYCNFGVSGDAKTKAELAKVGQEVDCPQCGKTFRKANKWHLFCSNNRKPRPDGGNCSDDWHNARKAGAASTQSGVSA